MPRTAKNFCIFFIFLALVALGGDIYIWQMSNGHPFAFAALGYLTKTYLAEYHQMVVDTLTPETFNAVLTPVLAIPSFFFCLGLAGFSLVMGALSKVLGGLKKGEETPKNTAFKYNRR